jgi:hypothetical protein
LERLDKLCKSLRPSTLFGRTASFACHTHLLHKVTLTNGSFEIEAEDVEYKWTPLLAVRPLALRTKPGATLLFGVRKPTTDTTAYFHCLSLHLRMQKWGGQDKFLSALPRPPAGPYAVEELLRWKMTEKTLR